MIRSSSRQSAIIGDIHSCCGSKSIKHASSVNAHKLHDASHRVRRDKVNGQAPRGDARIDAIEHHKIDFAKARAG